MGSKARAIEGVHRRKRESARTGRALSSQIRWRAAGLAVCAVPCDPRNVRSGDADVGQFTVAELVELIEARIVTPPGLRKLRIATNMIFAFLFPDNRRVILRPR